MVMMVTNWVCVQKDGEQLLVQDHMSGGGQAQRWKSKKGGVCLLGETRYIHTATGVCRTSSHLRSGDKICQAESWLCFQRTRHTKTATLKLAGHRGKRCPCVKEAVS